MFKDRLFVELLKTVSKCGEKSEFYQILHSHMKEFIIIINYYLIIIY